MKYLSVVVALFVLGCAHQVAPLDRSEWPPYGYTDFSPNINQTAGLGSLNCGLLDKTAQRPAESNLESSRNCLRFAIQNKEPFKFGEVRIPDDSMLFRVLVLSEEKEFWDISLDRMLDGSDMSLTLKKCENATVDYKRLTFVAVDCAPVDNDEWPQQ